MKKILSVLLVSVAMCVNAQMYVPYSKYESRYVLDRSVAEVTYSGNVGLSGGAVLPTSGNDAIGTFGFITEHGLKITKPYWGSSVFVGLGTGLSLYFLRDDYYSFIYNKNITELFLPLYLTTRIDLNYRHKVNPFIKVDFGYFGGLYEWYGNPINDSGEILYSYNIMAGAEAGASFRIDRHNNRLSVGAGYRAIIEPEYPSCSHQLQLTIRIEF